MKEVVRDVEVAPVCVVCAATVVSRVIKLDKVDLFMIFRMRQRSL